MLKVLAVGFSQTGQLSRLMDSVLGPVNESTQIKVTRITLETHRKFPFPWNFFNFFDTMPECVYEDAPAIEPKDLDPDAEFDLIILGYQAWFLSPCPPIISFLKSEAARKIINGKPVMTLIGCRNMWLMAQESIKERVDDLGGHLIDNVVLVDEAHAAYTFYSTPIWMLTGNKGPYFNGKIPKAGLTDEQIENASRFGDAIVRQLPNRDVADSSPMMSGLGAVKISEGLIASEKVAKRNFRMWGGLMRKFGNPDAIARKFILIIYFTFLAIIVLTIMPILAVVKKLLKPFTKAKVASQKAYFARPSGEGRELWDVEQAEKLEKGTA